MSTETLNTENSNKLSDHKLDTIKLDKKFDNQEISNLDLNKLKFNTLKKTKQRTCINNLKDRLRKKEVKKKYENRIIYGLFVSFVAILFYIST
tara:strand:+ start:306 stop:584 length:279 start_codon:yes stop_codon:yes gene_type:complete